MTQNLTLECLELSSEIQLYNLILCNEINDIVSQIQLSFKPDKEIEKVVTFLKKLDNFNGFCEEVKLKHDSGFIIFGYKYKKLYIEVATYGNSVNGCCRIYLNNDSQTKEMINSLIENLKLFEL